MKTVLILGNSSGGLYDFRNEFVLELLRNYRVVVSMPDTVKTDLLTAEGCEVVHTDINRRGVNPSEDLKLIRAYRAFMKEVRPDLVITYTIKPNVYGGYVCGKLGIPYISTVTGLGSAFEKTGIFLKLIHMLYRKGMKKASCVFFQNSANRKLFEENRLVTGKTRLVSGSGVNLEKNRFEPYPAEGPVRFLYVGRIMREKGIGELLEAAREIHKDPEYSGAEFDILGYCDEDWQETLDEAGKSGIIKQLGFDPEVHSYYRASSAVVLPTYHEGMSNVLMEASACGRPVIATRIDGCREIFEDGVTGFGCEPKNAKSLEGAIRRFLALPSEERAKMGAAARAKMEREFDRRKVTEAYMEEVRNILG